MSQPAHAARTRPKEGLFSRFPEAGLGLVIVVIAAVLGVFGGSVERPMFERAADGSRQRVFKEAANGEKVAATEKVNKFANARNLAQLAKDTSFVAIMAVGMTVVIVSGGIDLSVGAIYALASVLGALVFHRYGPEGMPNAGGAWFGAACCVGVGLVCGLLNGGMIVALKVHPFIITLGTMAVYRGIAFVATNGQSVGGFPEEFRKLITWEAGEGLSVVPLLTLLMVAVCGWIFLARLVPGRQVYAIGGNETAARFSGIRVQRVKLLVFALSGLTAGVAGLLSLGYYGAATSGDGQGYELNVIAAAVVGGASLSGGKGTALGAVLGALIIQMISSGIVILNIDQNYSQIITGAVVITAVVLDQVNGWMSRKRALKTG